MEKNVNSEDETKANPVFDWLDPRKLIFVKVYKKRRLTYYKKANKPKNNPIRQFAINLYECVC